MCASGIAGQWLSIEFQGRQPGSKSRPWHQAASGQIVLLLVSQFSYL